ncbi:anhydro-N-acetylmuramic acid kinase [Spongiimicrobium sp. 3-5]|uniref:anhydro-N-acetylmuramic acid kinase n=1 Tax=Spongiimicrobium sp. 3-5 TaxID=3332596 RepID=UPI003981640C
MKKHKVIGLMSGTSLDGLDLAYCHIWKTDHKWEFEILNTKSISYDAAMRNKLKNSIDLAADDLLLFNNSYGTWLGQKSKEFINENNLEVDFIASHGHTTHHQPKKGLTYQIGSGQHLANECGLKVVCDFRSNDIALGGEGAPLVPIGDRLFFENFDFCLNLGGISNISFEHQGKRIAYDIGLANMILNHITQKIDLAYDAGGKLASTGQINQTMLQRLNDLPYYSLPFPKSIGYEWFVEEVVPIVEETHDSIPNLLCTGIHHICEQVAKEIKANAPKNNNSLFVAGGGALNDFMIQTLQAKLGSETEVAVTSNTLIEFKEALVFGLMGVLRIEGEPNVLCSVTGAKRDSCSGVIYLPS